MLKVKSNDKDMERNIDNVIERNIDLKIRSIVNNAKTNDEIINNVVELITLLAHIDNENGEIDYITDRIEKIVSIKDDMINNIVEFVLDCLQ